ncbi:MAG: large repetitive protein, partial [Frankiales bacterium]|nr:large repetitive protein [Frankiales bacterium]
MLLGDPNTAPDAQPDSITVAGGTGAGSVDVLANDTDIDGDTLTISAVSGATHGTTSCSGSVCDYTPAVGFYGDDSFSYTVADGNGGEATATVTVTVTNQPPVFSSPARGSIAPGVTPNPVTATDPNGDPVTFSAGPGLPSGLTLGTDGSFAGSLRAAGSYAFDVTADDGFGGQAVQSLTLDVPNTAPTAADPQSRTQAVGSGLAPLSAADANLDTLTFSKLSGSLPAGVVLNDDGSFTGALTTPGSTSAVIGVSDGSLSTSFTFTVVVPNTAPVATDDTVTALGGVTTVVDVLANDTDADADTLTITAVGAAGKGSVTCGPTSCSYTPAARAHGTDSFTYTVGDGRGGSDTATVAVTLTNTAPSVVGPLAQTLATASTPAPVTATDADLDVLSYSATGTLPAGLSFGTNGVFTGTIARSAGHTTFPLTVTVADGFGGSDSTTLTLTVLDDPPSAVADTLPTWKNVAAGVNVLTNDTDLNGDSLTVIAHTQGAHGSVACTGGLCTYTPSAGYVGADSFGYTIDDGYGAQRSATVSVSVLDRAPTAVADAAGTTVRVPVSVNVVANDTDPDAGDTLTVSAHGNAANGAVSCTTTTCTYTPSVSFAGTDSFGYTVVDPDGLTATSTVTITVLDRAPTPAADSKSVQGGNTTVLDVLANDTDPDGDTLTIQASTAPAHGSVSCASGVACSYTPTSGYYGADSFSYTVVDAYGKTATAAVSVTVLNTAPSFAAPSTTQTLATGRRPAAVLASDLNNDPLSYTITGTLPAGLGYTAAGSFTGAIAASAGHRTYPLTVTADDGHGGTASASLTIVVPNDPPSAGDDTGNTPKNVPVLIPVLANDTDVNGDTLVVQSPTAAAHGGVACDSTGCTYSPAAGYVGADSFTYTSADGFGGVDTATVSLTVFDRAPVAVADTASTTEAVPVSVPVIANDTDPDGDALTVQSSTPGANGGVVCDATTCTYSPVFGFVGSDSFTYRVVDVNGLTATGTVTVSVLNQAPLAVADATMTTEGVAVSLDPRVNDSDPDGDALTVTGHGSAAHGTVSCTATACTYSPVFGFVGTDSFGYTITDTHGATATATVTVTVLNRTPVAVADARSTTEGVAVSLDPRTNDSDPDGDAITVTAHGAAANGTVNCTTSACTYSPVFGFVGTDSFDYTITDTHGATATATVTVTVLNR